MNDNLNFESLGIKFSLSLINKTIEKYFKDNKINNKELINENNDNNNNIKIIKISKAFESFFKKGKGKIYFEFKYKNFLKLFLYNITYKESIKMKIENFIDKIAILNKVLENISVILLIDFINKKKHNNIQNYIKILLLFTSNKILKIETFFRILDIFLKTIIYQIEDINNKKLYKFFKLKNEPLLFINDIIEGIINYPIILKNNKFIEEFFSLFNNFFIIAKDKNIFIEKGIEWLKLFESKEININFSKLEEQLQNDYIEKIINFLINIYKNHIPLDFYNEIFKKSAIDLVYYLNILKFLQKLFENESNSLNDEFEFKNGVYLLGNKKSYASNIKKPSQFSLVFSFKIKEIKKEEEILIFKFFHSSYKGKDNIISIIINKDKNLVLLINKECIWDTNIIIEPNKFYLVCFICDKSNKNMALYINNEKISTQNIFKEKLVKTDNCYKYLIKKNQYPNFTEDINILIGDDYFYGIMGEILLINIALEKQSIEHLFNSKDYYSNLLYRNKIKLNLIINKTISSQKCINAIEHFSKLNYKCLLRIMPKSLYPKDKFKETSKLFEYKITYSCLQLINEKGIEFLIFMLHNINSRIKDKKIFDLFIYKTIDFIFCIYSNFKIFKKKFSFFEIDRDFAKQINIFFLTLLYSLKLNKKKNLYINNNFYLSNDLRNSLINCLSLKFQNNENNNHLNIIANIIFGNEFFEQNENTLKINESYIDKINFLDFNKEIIYNILLMDSIFLLKDVNHKNLFILLGSLLSSNNSQFVCKELVNYLSKISNEIKLYHYLKLIYYNLDIIKKNLVFNDGKENLLMLTEENFQSFKYEHCKYCSYIIILCYLIKEELWIEIGGKKDYKFEFNSIGFMASPSFLFIRCLFIQNFKLNNTRKFQFIKLKSKILYNMDFFEKDIKQNPIELIDNKGFIIRFNDLIKYIKFLLVKEKTKQLKNILDNYFLLVIEFLEKIENIKTSKTKREIISFINNLLYSDWKNNFLILYLEYNEEKALKIIKKFIKFNLNDFFNPLLNIISQKTEIKNKKKFDNIKIEIIKCIIDEILNRNEIKNKETINIIYFLITIYNTIFGNNIEMPINFENIFNNYINFIIENNLFLDRRPINLNYNIISNNNYIADINEINNNRTFISELIIDIVIILSFNDNIDNYKKLNDILIKDNTHSIFYINDIENLKKKSIHENNYKSPICGKEINYFLFTLYYLIKFFKLYNLYKNEENEKMKIIDNILKILFNDLKKIYKETKKITSILKKVENYGQNFEIYNLMLSICNKSYKDSQFSMKYLYGKFSNIKPTKIDNNNKYKNINIFADVTENDNNFDEINKKKNKMIRAKSFDKLIPNNIKEKILANLDERITINTINNNSIFINEDILNKSQLYDLNINFNDSDNNNEKVELKDKINVLDNKSEDENYLKNKISKYNIMDFYYEQNINLFSSDDIKMLFNPKNHFFWKNFTIAFKDIIYNNKKFKKISKVFDITTRDFDVIFSSQKDKQFFLNYPTKLKNYIIDEYYRPFLKPYLNFFKHKHIKVTHSYINNNILNNSQFKDDNISLIQFKRLFPKLTNSIKKIFCERIKNKGNIFGYIIFNNDYMIFANSPKDDQRKSKDLKKYLEYIYSSIEDSIIDENKYTIIFYKEIKEIIKRRVCLNYVGYEIFMKDNLSYFFNFFNKENSKIFSEEINNFHEKIKIENKTVNIINEEDKKNDKNSININKKYDFKFIDDPINTFEKMQYKSQYKRGEISNFNYLLLVNKYSSRSFNDNSQYLIFPLLFLDESRNKKRDLSLIICLNRSDKKDILERIMNNRKFMGYYFTQHVSTSGFVLYYLVRLFPFTNTHIDLQSGKFDMPGRLFSSMKYFLSFLDLIQENRELIPEFFYNYEFLINLNHNFLGKYKSKKECYYLNNFDSNKGETFYEFIFSQRNMLEKSDISPWIDNIFGAYQFSNSDDHPNSFPLYSYEDFCEFEKIKQKPIPLEEKISQIEENLGVLKLGITPAKLFNKIHQGKNNQNNINDYDNEINNYFNKKEQKIIELINNYIQKKAKECENFYLINNNNSEEIELIFKLSSKIDIFKMKLGENKTNEISIITKDQIQIEPYNNLFCEIIPGLYCIVRNIDETIKFVYQKKIFEVFQWTCIITSVVPFTYKKKKEDKNIKKVFLGDEKGYLHLMKIEILPNQNDKNIGIKTITILKSVKAQSSLIKGLVYNEKLNIIITWSGEGVISILNDYTLTFLNIIDLGKNYDIKEIFISNYDLLYVNCYESQKDNYNIACYTLNGIKVTYLETRQKIVKFFVEEEIFIILDNKNIFGYKLYDFDNFQTNLFCDYNDNFGGNKVHIKFCSYYPKIRKLLIVFNDNKIIFKSLDKSDSNKIA